MVERGAVPDLALVDIDLRDGQGTGVGLARLLKSQWSIPTLFVSGQRSEARANHDSALGYIGKPHTPELILASIVVAKGIIEGQSPRLSEIPMGMEVFGVA